MFDHPMKIRRRSISAAEKFSRSVAWSAGIPAAAALIGSWAMNYYEPSAPLTLILGALAAWAALCSQVPGLVRGHVLSLDLFSFLFLVLAILSPTPIPLLTGVLFGISGYLFVLSGAVSHPRVALMSGDVLYALGHPLERLVPLAYLAPEPLSPVFDPAVALYWSPGAMGLPTWRISLFDPPSLHDYISSHASFLSARGSDWGTATSRYRNALMLLGLLDTLRRLESAGLDGAALAAAARLAISAFPESARLSLRDALTALPLSRRQALLEAFDLWLPDK
jgi:hypothetical protein